MSNGGSGKTESVIPFGFKLNLRSETADPLAKFLRSALARPVNPTSGIQFYFDPARFEIGDHVRKHLGNDPVSVAFIAACTGHHIPFWYSLGKTCSRASSGCLVSAMTTMFGSAIPCSLAVLQQRSASHLLCPFLRLSPTDEVADHHQARCDTDARLQRRVGLKITSHNRLVCSACSPAANNSRRRLAQGWAAGGMSALKQRTPPATPSPLSDRTCRSLP
jgi:hypothetical protein